MHRNKSVDVHRFAMIPKADIPRSSFDAQRLIKLLLTRVILFQFMWMRFYRVILLSLR